MFCRRLFVAAAICHGVTVRDLAIDYRTLIETGSSSRRQVLSSNSSTTAVTRRESGTLNVSGMPGPVSPRSDTIFTSRNCKFGPPPSLSSQSLAPIKMS